LLGMFLSLKTLYRKRTVIWPFYFYTIIRTLSKYVANNETDEKESIYNGKSIAGSVVYFLKVKNKPTVAKLLKYIMIMVTKIVTIA
ncbi:hypothetical protein W364_02655, partial [Staphylococcus aureus DAR5808]